MSGWLILLCCLGGCRQGADPVASSGTTEEVRADATPQKGVAEEGVSGETPAAASDPGTEPVAGTQTEAEPKAPTYGSPEDLAVAVLNGFMDRDVKTLRRLRVDEGLYMNVLWPEFDLEKPNQNIPGEFHWDLLHLKSEKAMQANIHDHGGRHLLLVEVQPQEVREYKKFKLWHNCKFTTLADGEEVDLEIVGSLVEYQGKFSVLAYKD